MASSHAIAPLCRAQTQDTGGVSCQVRESEKGRESRAGLALSARGAYVVTLTDVPGPHGCIGGGSEGGGGIGLGGGGGEGGGNWRRPW